MAESLGLFRSFYRAIRFALPDIAYARPDATLADIEAAAEAAYAHELVIRPPPPRSMPSRGRRRCRCWKR